MPPKARITRELILDAAFQIAREQGIAQVSARSIAKRLHCSTQPVLYHFATVEQICKETYQRADAYHSAYIAPTKENPSMLEVGAAYVRFAAEEKQLFRLLFQSDHFSQQSLSDLVNDEGAQPLIALLAKTLDLPPDKAKDAFTARFLMVHGMASMLANNSMEYDEDTVLRLLRAQFAPHSQEEEH